MYKFPRSGGVGRTMQSTYNGLSREDTPRHGGGLRYSSGNNSIFDRIVPKTRRWANVEMGCRLPGGMPSLVGATSETRDHLRSSGSKVQFSLKAHWSSSSESSTCNLNQLIPYKPIKGPFNGLKSDTFLDSPNCLPLGPGRTCASKPSSRFIVSCT